MENIHKKKKKEKLVANKKSGPNTKKFGGT